MPNITVGKKIIQTQVDNPVAEELDAISARTYVPRAKLLELAITRFLDDVRNNRVQMGMTALGSPSAPGSTGPQASFTVVPEPPKS